MNAMAHVQERSLWRIYALEAKYEFLKVWRMPGYVIPNSEDPQFQVEYVAGFLSADQPDSDMPGEIQRSATETVKEWFLTLKRAADVQSKSVGDLSITYVTGNGAKMAVPSRAMSRLEKWMRLV